MSSGPGPGEPTVRTLVRALGSSVARPLSEGAGLDRPVTRLVVWEPEPPVEIAEGDVVVIVGGGRPQLDQVHGLARDAGAAAVVVRASGTAWSAADDGGGGGPAVLAVPPDVGWEAFLAGTAAVLARRSWNGPDAPLGDLFALADAIAAAVGGPVVIDDPGLRLLAYSSLEHPLDPLRVAGITARRTPGQELDRLRRDGSLQRLWRSGDVVRLSGFEGAADRLAVAVRAGNEILGAIFVAESAQRLDDEAVVVLRHAADMAAAHLLHAHGRLHRDDGRDSRDDALRAALDGRPLPAGRPPLPEPGSGYRVLALRTDAVGSARRRLVEATALRLRAAGHAAVVSDEGVAVYALVADAGASQELRSTAARLAGDAHAAAGTPVCVAIGSPAGDVGGVGRSRRDADNLLRLPGAANQTVVSFEEWRHRTFLLELQDLDAVRHHGRTAAVQAMVDHDRAHGTSYAATVRAYLDAQANASVAADELHVHHNTVRYRVSRAQARFGIGLDDPVERLVTQLELHLLDAPVPA